jgi:hypothetical protein
LLTIRFIILILNYKTSDIVNSVLH